MGNETILYNFTGSADGGNPEATVSVDSVGNVYGTTSAGGAAGSGVVYKVDATGNQMALYSFTGAADGGQPGYCGITLAPSGYLYGTTQFGGRAGGVVFKIQP